LADDIEVHSRQLRPHRWPDLGTEPAHGVHIGPKVHLAGEHHIRVPEGQRVGEIGAVTAGIHTVGHDERLHLGRQPRNGLPIQVAHRHRGTRLLADQPLIAA